MRFYVVGLFPRGDMKDFDAWNNTKKQTHEYKRPFFKEAEIWWCRVGVNIGDEQDGKGNKFLRPVIIVRKFNTNVFIGVPLSTKIKANRFNYRIHFKGIDQVALLSQVKLWDAKRFEIKMGELPAYEFAELKAKLKELIF